MTNQIKNFIEEGEKEYEEKFCHNLDDTEGVLSFYETTQAENVKQFISSRQISLIKMIVEMMESEPIYTKTFSPEIRLINLDTISSKLKKVYEEKINR